MPISPARQTAYQILRRVESGRLFAIDLLQSAQVERLKDVDRNLTTELVMGVLRWRGDLDDWVERLSRKPLKSFDPEVATILRMGVYQIRHLGRIPEWAAVNEAVELAKFARKRSAAGLVNAVLRKVKRPARRHPAARGSEAAGLPDSEAMESACRSLPAWLRDRWERNFGSEGMKSLAWASVLVPPTTLRVSSPDRREEVRQRLETEGIATRPGRYSPWALPVESGSVQKSGAWCEGLVVIQDEGSQLVAELVAPRPGERVLDLCAAPGIKLRQLGAAQGRGLLIACDLSARRLRTLTILLPKNLPPDLQLGLIRLDATQELPFGCDFHRILVDAPCSGTGTLARNPEVKWRLQPNDLPRLAEMQSRILENALGRLASGGRLVYATCSLEPEENEGVIEKVLRERQDVRQLRVGELVQEFPALKTLFDENGYLRTRPDIHGMDGFFAAVMSRVV